jgi:hypothetical protein
MLENEIELNNLCEKHLQAPAIETYELVLAKINSLVTHYMDHNFLGLVQLLYRIDVSEKHIAAIAETAILDSEAIAKLMLDRIIEKMKFKKENTLPKTDEGVNASEKW